MHENDFFSKNNISYDLNIHGPHWIGGHFSCSNLSQGYHGILIQYILNHINYNDELDVLLISENNTVKKEFNHVYKNWNIKTTNYCPDPYSNDCDINIDLCDESSELLNNYKFDLIINQATLEHVINPFGVMKNLFNILKKDGLIVNHTHPPNFPYHQYPRDYFRFMKDWWYDLEKYNKNIELIELYMCNNLHVFTAYKKNN